MITGVIASGRRTPSAGLGLTVINPGAEAGDMTGWTADPTNFVNINTTGGAFPGPKSGSRYFGAGTVAAAKMYQIIDVSAHASAIDAESMVAKMTAFVSAFGNDAGRTKLVALSAADVALDSFQSPETTYPIPWTLLETRLGLPPLTRKLRLEFSATRYDGSANDIWIDDISAVLSVPSIYTSYRSTIGRGNRSAAITLSLVGISTGGGSLAGLIDGSQANNWWFNNATGTGVGWLLFDFGIGVSKVIDQFRWYQSTSATHGVWRFEGSNDSSTWTQVGADFTLGGFDTLYTFAGNTTAYRYYRIRHMSGARTSSPYLREIEFRAS